MYNGAIRVAASLAVFLLAVAASFSPAYSQTLDKMRLGYSGTGLNNYVLEMGRRGGIFRKNGLDLEVVYVNSGSLLNQALIAGTFDVLFFSGLRGDVSETPRRRHAHYRSGRESIQPCLSNGPGDHFDQATEGQESCGQPLRLRFSLPKQSRTQGGRLGP